MKTTIQHDQRDCGAACLHMIAKHYGYSQPLTKFRELTKTDRNGASVYGLIAAADAIGLKGEAMSGSIEELSREIAKERVRFPLIAHIITDHGLAHFVVISDLKKGCFTVHDPGRGKVRISRDDFSRMWTGYVITFEKTDRFKKQHSQSSGLPRFFVLLKHQHRIIAAAIILSLIISVIGVAGAFVFQLVIDNCPETEEIHTEQCAEEHGHTNELVKNGPDGEEYSAGVFFESVNQKNLTVIFVSLICLYLLASMIQYFRGRLIIAVSRNIDVNMTLPYFNRIIDMPVHSAEQRQTGDYLSRFSDASKIRDAISTTALTLVLDSLMAVGCGVVLYIQNRGLFLISISVIVMYALIVFLFRQRLSEANRNLMEANAVVQSYMKESVEGLSAVKAAVAETEVKKKFQNKFEAFVSAIVKRSRLGTSLDTIVTALQSIGVAVILWCGFAKVLAGLLPLGTLITFYALLSYFIEPVKNLISLQPTLQTASAAAERLSDILDASKESETAGGRHLPHIETWGAEHVDFRYGNDELTLRDVSLSVKSGERIAIIGESGCGKTTLAKMFLRFHEPESGEITANGISLKEYLLQDVRNAIAYVDQNVFLFSGTIRDNLLLGNPDTEEVRLADACRAAGIYEFIRKLPLGFDSFIEENGSNLSGGQKQRIAIARALLKKPQLLILDEATSNLDPATEAGIRNTITGLDSETACIIIAHRMSTIKSCDRIYVMHEGQIVESGSHEELAAKSGRYAEMLRYQ